MEWRIEYFEDYAKTEGGHELVWRSPNLKTLKVHSKWRSQIGIMILVSVVGLVVGIAIVTAEGR